MSRHPCLPILLAAVAACTTPGEPPAGESAWSGSITTAGSVTTVRNESGSVWGGTATLIEEASIGVEAGADPYMLGEVTAVAASADRIFVGDQQVPSLRVYDHAGVHLYDIGRPGQGPGEYQSLSSIALASDARVFLRDDRARRIWIYTAEGEYLGAFEKRGALFSSMPLLLSRDDVPYTLVLIRMLPDDPYRLWEIGMQAHGPDGPIGEPIVPPIDENFRPASLSSEDGNINRPVPFSPQEEWALTPSLQMIFGVSSAYRFQVREPDGSVRLVERVPELVPVDPDEATWQRRYQTAIMRDVVPGWVWNAPEIPAVKPAYSEFIPTLSGEIWVLRPGPGVRLQGCDEEARTAEELSARPCWDETDLLDVFGPDGRFLGPIDVPADMSFFPAPYVNGDLVVASVQDETGVNMIKRYRLALPEGP